MSETRLRVLVVHNGYQFRGGEDSVVDSEVALLREHGHDVHLYLREHGELQGVGRARLAAEAIWSKQTTHDMAGLLERLRPDVVHVHNTTPLVSPSVYWAAARQRVPVVQTLHNFRLFCAQAMFLREGRVCEDCLGHGMWRGVARRCYRGSLAQSAVLAASVSVHRSLGTYDNKVSRYIALNEFCRSKVIAGGLPAARVAVKPNFVEWRPEPQWAQRQGGLFVGRLSEEKGVQCLLEALRRENPPGFAVVGDGPLAPTVSAALGAASLGFRKLDEVWTLLERAAYLVLPSLWFEAFPRTIVEAYASGVPVIASRLGSLPELVEEGRTGLLFTPGDAADLADKLRWAEAHPAEMRAMGQRARQVYEERYSPKRNVAMLCAIYRDAMADMAHAG